MTNYNQLASEIHQNSVNHGFWNDNPGTQHYLMLVVCELAEAVEADRSGRVCFREAFDSFMKDWSEEARLEDPVKFHFEFESNFKSLVKDTTGDELADAVIRLLDLAAAHNVDFEHAKLVKVYMSGDWEFTEKVMAIITLLTDVTLSTEVSIVSAIRAIETLASHVDIDLQWHIAQKMRYNESRPFLHGKKY